MLGNIGRSNHDQSRNRTNAKLLAKLKAQQTRQVGFGQYLGFFNGYHQILSNGEQIPGEFISNSGVMVGDRVWWQRAIGQKIATFKVQVRGG